MSPFGMVDIRDPIITKTQVILRKFKAQLCSRPNVAHFLQVGLENGVAASAECFTTFSCLLFHLRKGRPSNAIRF